MSDAAQEFHRRRMGGGRGASRATSTRPTPTTSSANTRRRRRADRRRRRGGARRLSRLVAHDAAGAARHFAARLVRDPRAARRARPAAGARGGQDAARGDRRSGPRRADLRFLRRRSACGFPARSSPSVRPGVDIEVTREPVGVVGIITPWNFPIAIPAWKIAPALAYGNTVVFKPADLVPGCAHALADIIAARRHSQGRVQPRHGARLGGRARRCSITSLSTRSPSPARSRPAAGRRRLRRRDAQIPARDGRQESARRARRRRSAQIAVECAVNGAFFSTGQRCTASSRIIVDGASLPALRRCSD